MPFPAFATIDSLIDRESKLVTRYEIIPDPRERLAAVVADAGKLPPLDAKYQTPEYLVQGCVSQVWLAGSVADGACHYHFDADSPLVKGLAGIHVALFENANSNEATSFEPNLVERLGLSNFITPTRLNGLANVIHSLQKIAASG